MRSLLFLSPHFPPDSAAGTHRARILAPCLAEFGWQPVVLTVDPATIEGDLDDELGAAVDSGLRILRVRAWPHRWTRRAGFGDLGLRAYHRLRQTAVRLACRERLDAAFVTTYPTYPALIGAQLKRAFGVPFVLDLQDPWVGAWGREVGPGGVPDLRSRASRATATVLERRVAGSADALVSVTQRTIDELLVRVPGAAAVPQLELPIGWEPDDWVRVRGDGRANPLFERGDGHCHVCAVGTLLPTAREGLEALLAGVRRAVGSGAAGRTLRLWFAGTSNERRADAPQLVRPLADAAGVGERVSEHPPRLAYFDALRVLRDADAVLVLGSDEPHYTPSRAFPALASGRPVLARLHPRSPAWRLFESVAGTRPIELISTSESQAQQADAFAGAFLRVLARQHTPVQCSDDVLAPFTGRALAGRLAALLDRVARR